MSAPDHRPDATDQLSALLRDRILVLEKRPIRAGQLAVLGAGDFVTVAASDGQERRTPTMEVVVLGGRPIREPLAWAGPFVMNTKAEVMQAFEDFQKGRMGQIPAVHGAPTRVVSKG